MWLLVLHHCDIITVASGEKVQNVQKDEDGGDSAAALNVFLQGKSDKVTSDLTGFTDERDALQDASPPHMHRSCVTLVNNL